MRPIHNARLDKTRPVLVLTRDIVRPYMNRVTVAPITSTIKGLSTEVPVGKINGVDHDSVASCDNIITIPTADLGELIGYLLPTQEKILSSAIQAAFDLN